MSTTGNAESYIELRGSLSIPDAIHGKSAYEIAVMHGFDGTEEEWLVSLTEQTRANAAEIIEAADQAIERMEETSATECESIEAAGADALNDIAEAKATMLEEIEIAAEIVQTAGDSETAVMSQKAVTENFEAILSAFEIEGDHNLLDPNNVELGFYENIDGVLAPNEGWGSHQRTITPIPVVAGSKLYVRTNINNDASIGIFFLEEDGTTIVENKNVAACDAYSNAAGFVVPSGAVKLHLHINKIATYGHSLTDVCVSTTEMTEFKPYNAVKKPAVLKEDMLPKVVTDSISFPFAEYGMPVVYFNGDTTGISKDDKVTLSYVYGERNGTCTLKWQGSSSLSYPKKNYTVDFDNAFEAKSGWGAQKKYCLKANYIDFSHARNICAARLWGGIVKTRSKPVVSLTDLPNYGAVDGFPCMVVINDKYMGLYTFNIPKDGWMMGMGNGDTEAILCADYNKTNSPVTFHQPVTTLDGVFDLEYVSDEDNADWVVPSLNNLINACINSDGTDIDTTIAQYMDIQSAIDYFIYIVAIKAHDCLTKNYLLATYDGVRWFFSAYDLDATFGLHWDGTKFHEAYQKDTVACDTFSKTARTNKLFELLWANKKSEIVERYKYLTQKLTSWTNNKPLSEGVVEDTFINFAKDIPQAVLNEEIRLWKDLPSASVNNVHQIVGWYSIRKKNVEEELGI